MAVLSVHLILQFDKAWSQHLCGSAGILALAWPPGSPRRGVRHQLGLLCAPTGRTRLRAGAASAELCNVGPIT